MIVLYIFSAVNTAPGVSIGEGGDGTLLLLSRALALMQMARPKAVVYEIALMNIITRVGCSGKV